MIRLLTLCFSLACLLVFVWFGVTVDLGERTLFGHLRAIGSSREAKDLWDGTKSRVTDFIGIEAAKKAAAAKAREAVERLHPEPGSGRIQVEPGPPQEKLSPRDQRQMEELTGGAKRGVQGRTPPRPPERAKPAPAPSSTATRTAQASRKPPTSTTVSSSTPTRGTPPGQTAPAQKPK